MYRQTLIQKLKHDIAQGRVVTIVGTGVSVKACGNQEVEGCKVATWTGLLEHGVKHCKDIGKADEADAKLLTEQIKSGKTDFLISAAEHISHVLKQHSPGEFRRWLTETVGTLEIKDPDILDVLAALPGVLATLNYDSLIETATKRRPITWKEANKTQEVLQGKITDAVLHLHGWFDEPESVVLDMRSYLTVKDDPHAKAVLDSLTIVHTLLFVGCGDTVLDPNFTRLIEWGKEALKHVAPRHYLLCRTSEIRDFQKKLTSAPWLQPLDYGADYEELVPFLRSLAPPKESAKPVLKVSIGSSIEPFYARGPGDNYDSALLIYIRNQEGKPLRIDRAVYFRDLAAKIPVYANARPSNDYPDGYEVKFGRQWKEFDVLIQPGGEAHTYVPLAGSPTSIAVVAGKRGTLLLEYHLDGTSGTHQGKL
jgi:hypothetical protein